MLAAVIEPQHDSFLGVSWGTCHGSRYEYVQYADDLSRNEKVTNVMIACSKYHHVLQLRSQADIRSHRRKSEHHGLIRPRVHESLTITDLLSRYSLLLSNYCRIR